MYTYSLLPDGNELFKPRPGFKKQRFGFNTFFLETGFVFGHYEAIKYSLNYDLVMQTGENNALSLRIGYEMVKGSNYNKNNIPLFVNLLIGKKNMLELYGGAFLDLTNNKLNPVFGTGFRHQNPKGGFFYKIAVFMTTEREDNPITGVEEKKIWMYGPTLGLGWSF
jgi:hypothetical protein